MEFRALGSIEVIEEGNGPIALGGPKQRAVLAHLLLRANHLVPADVLIDEVWGEEPPETARNALQSYASHLRKALGTERLEGSRAGYRLRAEPSELDTVRFQSLLRDARRLLPIDARAAVGAFDHALALWRGPAFADLAGEPSLRAEAARLDDLRLGALEDRVEAQLTLGEHAGVVGELESLTARHPLRERFWEQLMLTLYRSGRQAEALAAYQRSREILADELGIDPSPELRRLHERILAQSPDLDASGEPLRGYRLLERLGEDSLGVLYRATQPNVGREVAIRVVHEHRANDPAFIRRFDAEAQAVATLEHPHVAPVYDYWREPGRAYVVTRFLRGGSLRDPIDRSEGLGLERGTRILEQVASALSAAHRRGLGHGNLGASNVLFDEEGNAYVTDFSIGSGAARMMDDVRALAALARESLGEHPPIAIDDALRRAENARDSDQVSSLLAEVVTALGPRAVTRASVGDEIRNPYKGLRPFLESDAGDFFGREAFVERLLERLSRRGNGARFVAVVGPSGSGKSSVVSAGLVAAIHGGAFPGSERWFVTDMHPGRHPFEELDAALMRVAVHPPAGLLARLESGPRGLVEVADAIVPEDTELLLVVDQFEEAFTLTENEDERALLLESLRVAAADPASRVHVVSTLRADFYDRPLKYPRMGPLLGTTTEVLSPLTPEELERAIVRPAERWGLTVDGGLVPQIAADVAEQPGALPLVQYALTELYDRRDDGRLTLDVYREIGGVGGALASSAEHLYSTRDEDAGEAVRQLFLRLVTLGEGTADTRRRVRLSELSALEVDPNAMRSAIDAYGRHRLLTFDRDPSTREPTVEVAHEALLGAWERFGGWIDAAREDVRMHRRLSNAASEWDASEREPSFLLAGSRLDQFEAWGSSTSLALGLEERRYLAASIVRRDEERAKESARRDRERSLERRSVKRLRALVTVFAVALLVAGSLAVVAKRQSDRAGRESRIASARELAAAAIANLDIDAQRAVLLAIQAVKTTRDVDGTVLPEAEEALHSAVVSRVVLTVPGIGGSLDWSPRGVFVTEGPEDSGVIDIRDDTTGESVLSFKGHDIDVNDVAFNADGSMLATTGDDGTLKVWDPATKENLWTFTGKADVWGPSFSLDGSLAAAAWQTERKIRVFDVSSGRLVRTIHVSAPQTTFSPDGRMLGISPWDSPTVAFDLATGEVAFKLRPHSGDPLWSPDGNLIAAGSVDGAVRLWDGHTGKLLSTVDAAPANVGSIDWSPDGSRLVTGSEDGTTKVWDVTERRLIEESSLSSEEMAGGVYNVAFSPDGTKVMAGDSKVTATQIWDVGIGGDAEWMNVATQTDADPYWPGDVAFLPDGRQLASTDERGNIVIWDVDTGRKRQTIRVGSPISSFDITPDGGVLVAGLQDGFAKAWDVTTGEELFNLPLHDEVGDVDWSPDGKHLVTATCGRIKIFDVTGGLVRTLNEEDNSCVFSARFSPDGRFVVIASKPGRGGSQDFRQMIWDWQSGAIVGSIRPGDGTNEAILAIFDPTGSRVVTNGSNGIPRIWDVDTGTSVLALPAHAGAPWDVAFSPDGSRIATAGTDGVVRLFDASSGKEVLELQGHQGTVVRLAFSPDGKKLASKSVDGTVRIWALDLDDLLGIAKQQVMRSLTDEECRQYLHVEACPAE